MKRLNMLIKNKKESIGDGIISGDICVEALEASGLTANERYHLGKWMDGLESGRHCLLALLESRAATSEANESTSSSGKGGGKSGAASRPMEMNMLSGTLSLPQDFLCDSGYLYESVFSRPPSAVVREALQMLALKAMEKSTASLRVDQINLALKQLRVEKLSAKSGKGGNGSGSGRGSEKKTTADGLPRPPDASQSQSQAQAQAQAPSVDESDDNKENEHEPGGTGTGTGTGTGASSGTGTEESASPESPGHSRCGSDTESWASVASASLSDPVSVLLPPAPPTHPTTTVGEKAAEKEREKVNGAVEVDRDLERFRLQIMVELIRMYVGTANRSRPVGDNSGTVGGAGGANGASRGGLSGEGAGGRGGVPEGIDVDTIEGHLDVPLQQVAEEAEAQVG